jgi:hypothetical protein
VTGDIYIKLPYGPVPRKGEAVLKEMINEKALEPLRAQRGHYEQQRYVAQKPCDLSVFNGAEIRQLEKVAARWENATAAEIEQASHLEIPWLVAEARGERLLDYEMAQFRTPVGEEPEDEIFYKSGKFKNYIRKIKGKNHA